MGLMNMIESFWKMKSRKIVPILSPEAVTSIMSTTSGKIVYLGDREAGIIRDIREETLSLNKNNLLRTKAYLKFYLENKEVHWSFLAHMVSRNGGWNMTDLKGSLIGKLLSPNEIRSFFEFLEKANAIIFHDAYAQLLLYRLSKKTNENLAYLLPFLGVSSFMKPVWDYFWNKRHSSFLTAALIVNEQQHLQKLIEISNYKSEVLNTFLFQTQERLGFTDVLLPYRKSNHQIEVAGITVENFIDVNERISIGKTLYGILFKEILTTATSFAINTPHTGSRADFWPDIFAKKESEIENGKHSSYIFSPTLKQAWPNYPHDFQDQEEWYTSPTVYSHLTEYYVPASYNLTQNYKSDLKKLQFIKELKGLVS